MAFTFLVSDRREIPVPGRPPPSVVAFGLCAVVMSAGALAARADGVHVRLDPVTALVQAGDTVTVTVNVTPADAQFNAFDLVFTYDPSRLTFLAVTPLSKQIGSLVTTACANLFHLFNANTAAGTLTANLSLLCNNVYLTGPGAIYTIKFKAGTVQGSTAVTLATGTQFYEAGVYVNPYDVTPATVSVGVVGAREPGARPGPGGGSGAGPAAATRLALRAPVPNPRRGRGTVAVPMALSRPAMVQLTLWDMTGRLVARRAAAPVAAGAHVLGWQLPRLTAGHYTIRATTPDGDAAEAPWTVVL